MLVICICASVARGTGVLEIRVVDDDSGRSLASRVYITNERGKSFAGVPQPDHSVVIYDKTDPLTNIHELYSLVRDKPVRIELPAGDYEILIERGKEYLPFREKFAVPEGGNIERVFRLQRFCDM